MVSYSYRLLASSSDKNTLDGAPIDALRKGLKDLEDLCDIVTDKFTAERDAFDRSS